MSILRGLKSSIPRNPQPTEAEIIDLTSDTEKQQDIEMADSPTVHCTPVPTPLAGEYFPIPRNVNHLTSPPKQARSISAPEHACLSVVSSSFSIDRRGNVTTHGQPSRLQLAPTASSAQTKEQDIVMHHENEPDGHVSSPESAPAASVIEPLLVPLASAAPVSNWAVTGVEALRVKESYDKPRRLLLSPEHGMIGVGIRGSVDWLSWNTPRSVFATLRVLLSLIRPVDCGAL